MQPTTTASRAWRKAPDDQPTELANGQTGQRANRIPRVARRPAKPGLFRRLHIHLLQYLLLTRIDKLGKRADDIERRLGTSAQDAHELAQLFRYSPLVEAQRRALRRELAQVATDFRQVRQRLDDLSAELAS